MKNARMGLILLAITASLAIAADSTYTLTPSTSSVQPSGASQAGAITIANGIRGVGVSIFDQRDGAVLDIDPINTAVRGYAWIYNAAAVQSDGGGGWLRYGALDVQGIADAGGIAAVGTEGVEGQFMTVPPAVTSGFVDWKLYYTTGTSVGSADGGTPVHRVTITTLY